MKLTIVIAASLFIVIAFLAINEMLFSGKQGFMAGWLSCIAHFIIRDYMLKEKNKQHGNF